MYQVLIKLYNRIPYNGWKIMVDNALQSNKLTQEEYERLMKEVESYAK